MLSYTASFGHLIYSSSSEVLILLVSPIRVTILCECLHSCSWISGLQKCFQRNRQPPPEALHIAGLPTADPYAWGDIDRCGDAQASEGANDRCADRQNSIETPIAACLLSGRSCKSLSARDRATVPVLHPFTIVAQRRSIVRGRDNTGLSLTSGQCSLEDCIHAARIGGRCALESKRAANFAGFAADCSYASTDIDPWSRWQKI